MIHLLWGTIRPEIMVKTLKHWMDLAYNKSDIQIHVAVNSQENVVFIEENELDYFLYWKTYIYRKDATYPEKIYKLTSWLKFQPDDILILPSDDIYAPLHWDKYLHWKFLSWDGALFLNDGYQGPDGGNLTIACMTYNCLKRLNRIILHPEYCHNFSDTEAFNNVKELGLLKDDRFVDNVVFEHRHFTNGKRHEDDVDKKNYSTWEQDEETYNRRKKYPLSKRIESLFPVMDDECRPGGLRSYE